MNTEHKRALSRRAAAFTQAEVSRAIRGAKAAGMAVARVEIDAEGKIVLISSAAESSDAALAAYNGWKSKQHAHAN